MFDANVLVALLDAEHKNHRPIKALVRHLFIAEAKLYYVQPAYLEVLNFWRRKSFTEYLEEIHASGSTMPGRFERAYRFHVEELRKHAATRSDLYFQDYAIKDLRDHLLRVGGKNQREVGRGLWSDFCQKAFVDRFATANSILQSLRVTYAKFADQDVYPIEAKAEWPRWESAIALIERHCLASNDAAILNMAAGGTDITGFVSNDYDVLIAAEAGALPRTVTCYTLLPW
jgi:predicted nucleic acid-binding protein